MGFVGVESDVLPDGHALLLGMGDHRRRRTVDVVPVHRVAVHQQCDLLPKREPQNVRHRAIVPGLAQSGRRVLPDRPDSV